MKLPNTLERGPRNEVLVLDSFDGMDIFIPCSDLDNAKNPWGKDSQIYDLEKNLIYDRGKEVVRKK